jgi:large repetitive protein
MMSWLRLLVLVPAVLATGCGVRSLDPDAGHGGGGGSVLPADAGRDVISPEPIVVIEPDRCGNGILDPSEACDDNNKTPGDGCSAICQVECFSLCGSTCGRPLPCIMVPKSCGNRRLDNGEACDDGNAEAGDDCNDSCTSIAPGWSCPLVGITCVPICGDGMIVGLETCDDGNTIAGDGCSEICLVEPSTARCGDGIRSGAEECDLGPLNDDVLYGGCTSQCRYGARCGDGILDGREQCDDGIRANIVTYGNMSGCAFDCTYPHYCGDAIVDVDEGEQCDFGPRNGDSTWVCSRDCKVYLD